MEDNKVITAFQRAEKHTSNATATLSEGQTSAANHVYIIRPELNLILNVYGRMVSGGKWKDYAILNGDSLAVFSIFKNAGETALYQVIKDPSLASKQGMWRITSSNGTILRRGHELKVTLKYFDQQLMKLIL